MIGLMFFGAIFLWFAICFSLLFFVSIRKHGYLSKVFSFFFGVILLVAPFYDEVLAREEFEKLCREGAVVTVDEKYARGKTVFLDDIKPIKTYAHTLPVITQKWSYKDVYEEDVIVEWNEYRSQGGWLARRIKLMGQSGPLTFNGYCYPEGSGTYIFNKLEIKKIQRTEK